MTVRPLQPISMTAVFVQIAKLSEEAFRALEQEIAGPSAFDADPERIDSLSLKMTLESETVRLIIEALYYLYRQINTTDLGSAELDGVVRTYLETIDIMDSVTDDESVAGEFLERLVGRTTKLLTKTKNSIRYDKYLQLTSGFLPSAEEFLPIIDLRPVMLENNTVFDQLIPIVQFRIRTGDRKGDREDLVFQMDQRALKRMRAAIDLAESMIDTIGGHNDLGKLLVKGRS